MTGAEPTPARSAVGGATSFSRAWTHARWRSWLSVGAVAVLAGLMFSASARLADGGGADTRDPQDLAQLVDTETGRVTELTERTSELDREVETLSARAGITVPAQDGDLVEREGVVSGSAPVTGKGLTVTLDDAPPTAVGAGPGGVEPQPDDLVVHQQDLQHVINALWAGGAEAMTLQGERVTSTSAFRCSGNILLLHGKVFSPPYEVTVVGDPAKMESALMSSEGVQMYLEYVDWVHLGWDVQRSDHLDLPAYDGGGLQYATVPDGTEVFG
ncbi:Uncharacterized conserved protein YlxW, UPF0749 family [Promicromonospora umidemergens]|uniref:DUF881 domain-containing protein n=1 Tax=Promicromonospora umidemergens TaxID=629679 RepID=A0ABP8XR61_9MICO|nr:DUF881 domain-containing protein [Promicromonospora umidemergens]MCP2285351.1 Uncharacterized conserved protein YlxW, UPF0749 family [Promicromonospora umidemergens]